jgi:hypothetical protein
MTCRQLYLVTAPPTLDELLDAEAGRETRTTSVDCKCPHRIPCYQVTPVLKTQLHPRSALPTPWRAFVGSSSKVWEGETNALSAIPRILNWRDEEAERAVRDPAQLRSSSTAPAILQKSKAKGMGFKPKGMSDPEARNGFFACRGCLRLRPESEFSDTVITKVLQGTKERACLDCGLSGGTVNRVPKYGRGVSWSVDGIWFVVCRDCRMVAEESPGKGRCRACWGKLPQVERLSDECVVAMVARGWEGHQEIGYLQYYGAPGGPWSCWVVKELRPGIQGVRARRRALGWRNEATVRERVESLRADRAKREWWGMNDLVPDREADYNMKMDLIKSFGFDVEVITGH